MTRLLYLTESIIICGLLSVGGGYSMLGASTTLRISKQETLGCQGTSGSCPGAAQSEHTTIGGDAVCFGWVRAGAGPAAANRPQ